MSTLKNVERLANGLSLSDRIALLRRLERATWASRLDAVVTRIRAQAPRLTQRDVLSLCKTVRRERSRRARRT